MENKILYIGIILSAVLMFSSCGKGSETDKNVQNKPKTFGSLDEASKNAKSDLLEVLNKNKDIKLNIDAKELEQSNPETPVKQYLVDFNRFVSQKDTVRGLKEISNDEGISIVPFVTGKKVVATASINKVKEGFTIGGLFNNKITSDINRVRQLVQSPKAEISYFEVPNIDAHVYMVVSDSVTRVFADYGTAFTIEKETRLAELMSVLKKDAVEFERKFGKDVKEKKLVK